MADISLTASMRSNLLQLQATTKLMDMTQEKIATGKKINSALDGPVEFFTAKGLTDRASDFGAIKDNMGQAISAVETASATLESVTDLVAQAKGLAVSAKAATTSAERANLAAQFDDLRTQIDALVGDATYNGINLVNGRGTVTGGTWLKAGSADVDAFTGWGNVSVTTVTTGASELTLDLTTEVQYDGAQHAIAKGGIFGVTGTETLNVTTDTDWTTQSGDVTATVSADATQLTIASSTASTTIAISSISLTGNTDVVLGDITLTLDFSADSPAGLTWNANASESLYNFASDGAEADSRIVAKYGVDQTTFETGNLSRSISGHTITLASDATTSGLAGETATLKITNPTGTGANDMTTTFNSDGTAKIVTLAKDASSAGLGISAAANSWSTDIDIDTAITAVDAARDTLRDHTRNFATNLGVIQTREDFTNEFVNALQAGADKLTLADGNEEAANMLALQTRQQLGIQALSMASQSAQAVLSLFR